VRMSSRALLLAATVLVVGAPVWAVGGQVTMDGLLHEMVDMERLATPPTGGYDNDQQSSYDRASTAPDKDGWWANGDAGQFIRSETNGDRTEFVMAEMTGPGAIVRLWSANPDGGGTIRIYLDGSTKPALERDFLALTTAAVPEFPAPFSGRRAMGANLYFPIPYQTSCKVTVDKPSLYYHVGYRTYPAGTNVEGFSMDRVRELRPLVDEIGAVLSQPGRMPRREAGAITRRATEVLGPGESWTLDLTGPSALTRLEFVIKEPDGRFKAASATGKDVGGSADLREVLRATTLTIRWDGEESPSVACPLGDFFATAPGLNPYRTLATGATREGHFYCNWFMPFRETAALTVTNTSQKALSFEFIGWAKPIAWPEDGLLAFHAKWHKEWLPATTTFVDWPLLECDGPGRFVGVMLGVMNTTSVWWGEGDEKIWVDDDAFPSYFGTGSEDYFGYAWCSPELFEHAYHAQSDVTGPGNFGYSSVVRHHLFDDIPFQHKYRMTIEKWAADGREYVGTAYWYSPVGAKDSFGALKPEDLTVRELPKPYKVDGALEGEDLETTVTGGDLRPQQGGWPNMSGQCQTWWLHPGAGDVMTVTVPVEKAGEYELVLGHCTAGDYGIHQIAWDGVKLGAPLDCFSEGGVVFTATSFGTIRVDKAGNHKLTIECVGQNAKADPARMFGLDYVLLKPKGAAK
jgi:hypothetical protein